MVILLAALYGVPRHLYEAASMDGAGKVRQFFNITLPMISPALFFCLIILTLAGLNQFAVAYTAFFGSASSAGASGTNDPALLYAIYLFQTAFQTFNMGYASALAWVLFGICLAITGVNMLMSRRFVFYQGGQQR
jgi:multiple sugar transport system permease protein